jgi:biopolymer transport protein ExbB
MTLMTLLAQAASVAQDSIMSLTEVTAEESMNILELAVKGGWIMIVLAILSVIGVDSFFERFSTLRKAMQRNPLFMERIHDNIKDDDLKSAANYCRSENTPLSRIIERGVKSFNFSAAQSGSSGSNAGRSGNTGMSTSGQRR